MVMLEASRIFCSFQMSFYPIFHVLIHVVINTHTHTHTYIQIPSNRCMLIVLVFWQDGLQKGILIHKDSLLFILALNAYLSSNCYLVKYRTTKSQLPTEYFFSFFPLPIPILSLTLRSLCSKKSSPCFDFDKHGMYLSLSLHASLLPRVPRHSRICLLKCSWIERWDINQTNSSTSPTTQTFTSSRYYHTERHLALWHYCFQIKRSIILQCQT